MAKAKTTGKKAVKAPAKAKKQQVAGAFDRTIMQKKRVLS